MKIYRPIGGVIVFVMSDASLAPAGFRTGERAGLSLKIRERWMIRTMVLGAALVFGFAMASSAAIAPVPFGAGSDLTIRVAEGCGPGFWRGPGGACHPFARGRLCPPGYHIGPEGKRCWPN